MTNVSMLLSTYIEEFSEDLLSAHESELDRMRGFFQDNKDIFDLLQKRDKLWQQQVDLDVSKTTNTLHTFLSYSTTA